MRNIRAAAESGWDFSSRWSRHYVETGTEKQIINELDFFDDIDTTSILPIDLNALLLTYDVNLHLALEIISSKDSNLNSSEKEDILFLVSLFKKIGKQRLRFFIDVEGSQDFDFRTKKLSKVISGASQISSKILNDKNVVLQSTSDGCIRTTQFNQTRQQWDSPNIWAPLQVFSEYKFINPQDDTGDSQDDTGDSQDDTGDSQSCFLKKALAVHNAAIKGNKPLFPEKYNENPNLIGSGGEYQTQFGFGWTNGAILQVCEILNNMNLKPDKKND